MKMPAKNKKNKRLLTLSSTSFRLRDTKMNKPIVHRQICPCCSDILLRQMQSGELCWYCRHCFQTMSAWIILDEASIRIMDNQYIGSDKEKYLVFPKNKYKTCEFKRVRFKHFLESLFGLTQSYHKILKQP